MSCFPVVLIVTLEGCWTAQMPPLNLYQRRHPSPAGLTVCGTQRCVLMDRDVSGSQRLRLSTTPDLAGEAKAASSSMMAPPPK